VPVQSSPAIHRGTATNHLELACVGQTISARINGIEVGAARDGALERGRVAIVVGRTAGSIVVDARFDNFVMSTTLSPKRRRLAPSDRPLDRLRQLGGGGVTLLWHEGCFVFSQAVMTEG
jgi:hypothetical protein